MHHHFHFLSRKMTVNVIDGRFCSRTSILRNIFSFLVVWICIILFRRLIPCLGILCFLLLDINLYRLNDGKPNEDWENIVYATKIYNNCVGTANCSEVYLSRLFVWFFLFCFAILNKRFRMWLIGLQEIYGLDLYIKYLCCWINFFDEL